MRRDVLDVHPAHSEGAATIPVGEAAIAAIEEEWTTHLGRRRMAQLREALTQLRAITDPYRRGS